MDWSKADRQLAACIRYLADSCLEPERDLLEQELSAREAGVVQGMVEDDEMAQLERNLVDLRRLLVKLKEVQAELRATSGFRRQAALSDFLRSD